MTTSWIALLLGLALAGASASMGAAAAAVSQFELTRWVSYRLRGLGGGGGGAGSTVRLLENPGRVLATANALTTLGIVSAAAAVPALLAQATPTFLGVFILTVGVPLFVSAAYIVPRVIGRRWAEPIVARGVPLLERLARPLAPFIPRRDPSARTTLAAVVAGADTESLAAADEIAVVSAVLTFADRPARDQMTPRTAIVALPEGMPAGEAAHVCAQAGYSRYPVYRGSLDEVIGVAHAFDLLRLQPEDPVPVRPLLAIPGTMRAADLMRDMQRGRGHLAVVLDEFGGTAGVVTLEDLLKNLVGEIFGHEGSAPTPPGAEAAPAPIIELEGNAPAARLEEAFGIPVGTRGVQTVGGLLVTALGRIPRAGERFLLRGLEFDVLAATSMRVDRVLVRRGPVRSVPLNRGEART
jgi:CBS domain containing-hemolysin-like protein